MSQSEVLGDMNVERHGSTTTLILSVSSHTYADQFSSVPKSGERPSADISSLSQQLSSLWYSVH